MLRMNGVVSKKTKKKTQRIINSLEPSKRIVHILCHWNVCDCFLFQCVCVGTFIVRTESMHSREKKNTDGKGP